MAQPTRILPRSNRSREPYRTRTIKEVGERRLVAHIARIVGRMPASVSVGIGDDAAMVRITSDRQLVASCDSVPEDLFAWKRGLISSFELGEYAVRVTLSDLASMGAHPIGLLWMIRVPSQARLSTFLEVARGFVRAARRFGAPLVGGDTKESRIFSIAATALGEIDPRRVITRDGARPGDIVFCTGRLGLAAAALTYFSRWSLTSGPLPGSATKRLRDSLWSPAPLLATGTALSRLGLCTSCIDNTDGLGRSLSEISKSSSYRIEIDEARLPLDPLAVTVAGLIGCDPIDLTLSFGLDLNLIGTLRRPTRLRGLTIIGRVNRGRGVGPLANRRRSAAYDKANAFEHFRESFDARIARAWKGRA